MEKLKDGFYVDNLVTNGESDEQVEVLQRQAREIMEKGGLDLRCWTSTGTTEDPGQSILGLRWNAADVCLSCVLPKSADINATATKRSLLAIVSMTP